MRGVSAHKTAGGGGRDGRSVCPACTHYWPVAVEIPRNVDLRNREIAWEVWEARTGAFARVPEVVSLRPGGPGVPRLLDALD
jgi:hypothetical protein